MKPATPGTPSGLDVRRKVDRLKRMDWALNPFALEDDDYLYLKTRLMKVLEGMMGTEFSRMVSDMTDLTFWTVLSKLARGTVRNEKQRAEELAQARSVVGDPRSFPRGSAAGFRGVPRWGPRSPWWGPWGSVMGSVEFRGVFFF